MLSFFPRGVLDEILNSIESVSEGFPSYSFIQSLTTASGSRLFDSVVEHWLIDPAARVRFPPKSWEFFQPNLLCFVLCYSFHVVRPPVWERASNSACHL